jgi:hypothetical protein
VREGDSYEAGQPGGSAVCLPRLPGNAHQHDQVRG